VTTNPQWEGGRAAMAKWVQQIHGTFQAYVAQLKCCALSIIGQEDWWLWIVHCSHHGVRRQGKARTLAAAQSAVETAATPLLNRPRTLH
jgi:hypothetical protein